MSPSSPQQGNRGWRKGIPLALASTIVALLLVELGFRIFFAIWVGPDVLLYGIAPTREEVQGEKHTVEGHENLMEGYTKYFPHQRRVDHEPETGETFAVRINNRGFRGRDFDDRKGPGIVRVITLGASSTFGFYDRDTETYPFLLESRLNADPNCSRRFEVINLGIPHLNTKEILALFRAEGLPLMPDIVTFYEGVNDAGQPLATSQIRDELKSALALRRVYRKARTKLLLVRYLDTAFLGAHSLNKYVGRRYSEQEIVDETGGKVARFIGDISQINDAAESNGATLILANQQATTTWLSRTDVKGITYEREVELIKEKLEREGSVEFMGKVLLHHDAMMRALRSWAASKRIPFVDVIGALDQDRDVLRSWVHLDAKGNRAVAEAFAGEITKHVCRGDGDARAGLDAR